ncbi:MAG: Fur family transcriptional regulator [Actinomycetes bacterium]
MTSETPAPQRMTRQRKAVEEALSKNKGFCSAQDLHATLRAQGNRVGLATVYSQLRGMVDAGMLDVIRSDAGEAMYRRCGAGDHHHHLRCRSCGNVEELHAPAVETWASEVASSSGYRDVSHSLEITGLCPACASG